MLNQLIDISPRQVEHLLDMLSTTPRKLAEYDITCTGQLIRLSLTSKCLEQTLPTVRAGALLALIGYNILSHSDLIEAYKTLEPEAKADLIPNFIANFKPCFMHLDEISKPDYIDPAGSGITHADRNRLNELIRRARLSIFEMSEIYEDSPHDAEHKALFIDFQRILNTAERQRIQLEPVGEPVAAIYHPMPEKKVTP